MGKKKYYAVVKGRNPGIYETWEDCEAQINGFKGAIYRSFSSEEEANDYLECNIIKGKGVGKLIPDGDHLEINVCKAIDVKGRIKNIQDLPLDNLEKIIIENDNANDYDEIMTMKDKFVEVLINVKLSKQINRNCLTIGASIIKGSIREFARIEIGSSKKNMRVFDQKMKDASRLFDESVKSVKSVHQDWTEKEILDYIQKRIPDYSSEESIPVDEYKDEVFQSIYLMKYGMAYTYLYYKMYSTFFETYVLEEKENEPIKVLALGCGTKIDLLGLKLAAAFLEVKNPIYYYGVDYKDWTEKDMCFLNEEGCFHVCGAQDFLKDKDNIYDYNVVTFPYSLSEIRGLNKGVVFKDVRDNLGKNSNSKNIYILTNIRDNDNYKCIDIDSLNQIVDTMENTSKMRLMGAIDVWSDGKDDSDERESICSIVPEGKELFKREILDKLNKLKEDWDKQNKLTEDAEGKQIKEFRIIMMINRKFINYCIRKLSKENKDDTECK